MNNTNAILPQRRPTFSFYRRGLRPGGRDFRNKPALDEIHEGSILIDDYLSILNKTGWKRTYIIQAPLSSERFDARIVSAMQKKKILGVTNRYLIIAKKA